MKSIKAVTVCRWLERSSIYESSNPSKLAHWQQRTQLWQLDSLITFGPEGTPLTTALSVNAGIIPYTLLVKRLSQSYKKLPEMPARADEGFPELRMMSFYHQICVRSSLMLGFTRTFTKSSVLN
jgi:hypothetical protein